MLNSFLAEEWLSRNDARRHSNKTVGSFQTVRSTRLSLVLYEFLFHSENFFRLELTDCEDDYSSLMTMHDESTTTLLFAFSCSSPSFTYTHTFLLFLTTSPSFLTLLPLLFLDILLSINSFLQPLPCPTYLPPTNAIPIPYSHIHPFLTIPIYMYISSISSIFTSRIRCGTRWKLRKNRNDWCALWNWSIMKNFSVCRCETASGDNLKLKRCLSHIGLLLFSIALLSETSITLNF